MRIDAGSEVLLSAAHATTKEFSPQRRRELSDSSSDLTIRFILLKRTRSSEFRWTFEALSVPRRLCGENFLTAKQGTHGYQ
jgi:hypothetical protein